MNFSNYQLGIIFSIGRYEPTENKFIIRHKDKHYIETISSSTTYNLYQQIYKNQKQYVIKLPNYKPDNWNSRNSEERSIPILSDYKDFLRAYMEIHSTLDYSTRHNRKSKYKALRLRIYGNKIIIQSINNLLFQNIQVTLKSVQILSNNKTAYISYTSFDEILKIYDYIYGVPYNESIWNDINIKLKIPKK